MAINKVDYDVLEVGVSVYAQQAEAIDTALTALVRMNGQLQDGWTNLTADTDIGQFESEYKHTLENARDAMQSISDYIRSYMDNRQEDDQQGAARISG